MANYADSTRTPRTLTEREQRALLKVTGEHRAGFRDHMLYAMALGTGLREHELLALDMGDVFDEDGRAKRRVSLRVFKRSADEPAIQEVVLPDLVRAKLEKLRAWKKGKGESLASDAPLFVSAGRKCKGDLPGGPGWSRSPTTSPTVPIILPVQCNILWVPRQGKEQDAGPRRTHDLTKQKERDRLRIVATERS